MPKKEVTPDVPLHACDPDGIQVRSFLSSDGRFEFPDPMPLEPPIGYNPDPDLGDLIKRLVYRELSTIADNAELDTFEESDDFDIEDDPIDPLTPYERVFEAPPAKTPLPAAASPVEAPGAGEPGVSSPPAGSSPVPPAPQPTTSSSSTVPST